MKDDDDDEGSGMMATQDLKSDITCCYDAILVDRPLSWNTAQNNHSNNNEILNQAWTKKYFRVSDEKANIFYTE